MKSRLDNILKEMALPLRDVLNKASQFNTKRYEHLILVWTNQFYWNLSTQEHWYGELKNFPSQVQHTTLKKNRYPTPQELYHEFWGTEEEDTTEARNILAAVSYVNSRVKDGLEKYPEILDSQVNVSNLIKFFREYHKALAIELSKGNIISKNWVRDIIENLFKEF